MNCPVRRVGPTRDRGDNERVDLIIIEYNKILKIIEFCS